ncbi:hypothetical protein DFS34DRAFT_309617 [Phlyctochytrium arcticum]|nr:hypothetical protein DFS34DRAFT_309617 [Phlyctochytrium arcticum]
MSGPSPLPAAEDLPPLPTDESQPDLPPTDGPKPTPTGPPLPRPSSPSRQSFLSDRNSEPNSPSRSSQPPPSYSRPASARSQSRRELLGQKLLSSASFIASGFNNVSFGSASILLLCVIFHVINHLTTDFALSRKGCLDAWMFIKSPFAQFPTLLAHHFVHTSIINLVLNGIAFPAFAVPLEKEVGSLQFLYMCIIFGFISSFVFVGLGAFLQLFIETGCVSGLSSLAFTFLTINAFSAQSSFTPQRILGRDMTNAMYPWLILLILFIFMPWSSTIGNLSGIVVGILYARNMLKLFMLSPHVVERFENVRGISSLARMSSYKPVAGNLQLPTNDFQSSIPGPSRPSQSRGLFGKVRGAFGGRTSYTPVGQSSADNDFGEDPLLWEEEDPRLSEDFEQP